MCRQQKISATSAAAPELQSGTRYHAEDFQLVGAGQEEGAEGSASQLNQNSTNPEKTLCSSEIAEIFADWEKNCPAD
jgi:hypothetical protein